MIEHDLESFRKLNFKTIYGYYDRAITSFQNIWKEHPFTIIFWNYPPFSDDISLELVHLHHQIMIKFLVERIGVLIIHPNCMRCRDAQDVPATRSIYQQLWFIYFADKGSLQAAHTENSLENNIIHAIAHDLQVYRQNRKVLHLHNLMKKTCHSALLLDNRKYAHSACTPEIYKVFIIDKLL